MEDKKEICKALLPVLQKTRGLCDLTDLKYKKLGPDQEIVTAIFENGATRKINVSIDSGLAMIRDIMNHIG